MRRTKVGSKISGWDATRLCIFATNWGPIWRDQCRTSDNQFPWRGALPLEYGDWVQEASTDWSSICSVLAYEQHARSLMNFQRPLLRAWSTYIRQPTGNDLRDIINGFRDKWGFPQAAGAIDGTHIRIKAPENIRNDYYNRKGWYSVLLQAIVDHRYRIWNINVGWPGKVHDARVLSNSIIYRSGENGTLFPDWREHINGVDVPICLLGDPAYPLLNWLMKPYSEGPNVTQSERQFNYRLSRARMTVECAFGRLKGRWRCLLKRNDTHLTLLPTMIAACCVLHNICETHGERFDEGLIPQEQNVQRHIPNNMAQGNNVNAIRDALRDHLYNENWLYINVINSSLLLNSHVKTWYFHLSAYL